VSNIFIDGLNLQTAILIFPGCSGYVVGGNENKATLTGLCLGIRVLQHECIKCMYVLD
jgi:hypothetical protein